MAKYIFLVLVIMIPVCTIRAQDTGNMDLARQAFEYIKAGQGQEVIAMSNEDIRKNVTAETFSNTFAQLEPQVGSYQSVGEWKTLTVGDKLYYYLDVQFEKMALRFSVGFDEENKIYSILFTPIPNKTPPQFVENDKYKEEPFEVVTGEYKMPGILTLPVGVQNPPVVILVHGSGSSDRDETIGPNKPFRELAWGLAEHGIAVIRYDKRSYVYGASFAPEGKEDMDEETVNDALSAVLLARSHKSLSGSDVYILGHSQGAFLAPRMAEREPSLAGIIMVAGNARRFEDIVVDQFQYLKNFPSTGLTEDMATEIKVQAANAKKLGTPAFDESIPLPLINNKTYWEYLNNYNQIETARKLTLPIFVIQGGRDYQVTMEDYNMWKEALKDRKNAYFKSYPLLNHLLHEGTGKATPMEYSVEGKIPVYVIDDIAEWILSNEQ